MIRITDGNYSLVEAGMVWVDPNTIISNQSDKIGSEQDRQLLVKLINKLHDQNMLAVSRKEKHSFDIIGYSVNQREKSLWDAHNTKGYEAQTSARRDSIEENKGKGERWGIPIVWVAEDKGVLAEIRNYTDGSVEYLLV